MREGLNFNVLLKKYGITPLSLKAGEMKNPLSSLGPVTSSEIREEQRRLVEVHDSFIQLCRAKRPQLDPAICDGSVVFGDQAVEYGLVDVLMTSDEYILSKVQDNHLVLQLHKCHNKGSTASIFARALDVLPHLKQRFILQGKKNFNMDEIIGRIVTGIALANMFRNRFKLF